MVHVRSQERQRQNVVTVMTLASVSTVFPWQKGQAVGRATSSWLRNSFIILFLYRRKPAHR
jgi:hypothetical protein